MLLKHIYTGIENNQLDSLLKEEQCNIFDMCNKIYHWCNKSQENVETFYWPIYKWKEDKLSLLKEQMLCIGIVLIDAHTWKYKASENYNPIEFKDSEYSLDDLPHFAKKYMSTIKRLLESPGCVIKHPEIGIHPTHFSLLAHLLEQYSTAFYTTHCDLLDKFTNQLDKVITVNILGNKPIYQPSIQSKLDKG